MRFAPQTLALSFLSLSLACAVPQLLAKKKEKLPSPTSNERRRAAHALNRLTFGPRPGDIQQVTAMGVEKWIDLQLHPERIPDDAMRTRMEPLRTLRMSSTELAEDFPDGPLIRQVADGKKPMPSDPARRAVYQVQIAKLEDKKERKEEAANTAADKASDKKGPSPEQGNAAGAGEESVAPNTAGDASSAGMMNSGDNMTAATANKQAHDFPLSQRREERLFANLEIHQLLDLAPGERYKKILAMPVETQLAVADSMRGAKNRELLEGMNAQQRETLLAMVNPQGVIMDELIEGKLLRAIYSERQLDEVMTDFWFNHFNVYAAKGADRVLVTAYERDVIRPHALGKFEDLLLATARSPAMLFYLDNWLSVGPNSPQGLGLPKDSLNHHGRPRRIPAANGKRKQNSGLNENYGRELLELHTLSVGGGYSQRDVTEVAKVFTGWTIEKPNDGGAFKFDPRMHEPGPKFVLGHRIKPKGENEGRELLHQLATSPQTAHFISLKLAQRFVADDPPPALVDRMTKTYLKKKGDIREVLSSLFHSPEFWSDESYRAKVKTPLEFVVSAVRATGAEVEDAMPLARQLSNMGMPLFAAQPPTGYSMKADTWVSSSALLNRMNFALALTAGKIHGVATAGSQASGNNAGVQDATLMLSAMESNLLASDVSKQTHDSVVAQIQASPEKKSGAHPANSSTIEGLLLGSPEFQRR